MKIVQKNFQNEENFLKLSQNVSKIRENEVLSLEIYFETDLEPKTH